MSDNYSFRWGVDLFDNKHTQIPNWVLVYYHRVGVTNTEMMFITHLASFKHETASGKASPSLTKTLRERMGYKSNQGIINVQNGLVEKGLLVVHKSQGRRSVYDFAPFSKQVIRIAMLEGLDTDTENPSTKLDESDKDEILDQSTKLDEESSTKLDWSRQQNLTQKEEVKENRKEKVSAKINFALPPYPHSSLSGEVVFFQDGDTLHRAIVTRVMGKTLNLTFTESGLKKKHVRPAGAVFYQNGSEELSPVGAGEPEKKMSDGETTIFNAIIDLMPEPGFIAEEPYKRAKRMKEIIDSARKAHASGIQAGEFTAFGIWHQDVSWAGRDSPPPITLETIRKNWAQFQTYRGGKNGQVGQGNPEGQSGTGNQAKTTTNNQTQAYIEQNRDNLQRKIERLTR